MILRENIEWTNGDVEVNGNTIRNIVLLQESVDHALDKVYIPVRYENDF